MQKINNVEILLRCGVNETECKFYIADCSHYCKWQKVNYCHNPEAQKEAPKIKLKEIGK